jgi:hypothetical protein
VKPKPINAVAVRTQDIKVRSMLIRVRSQEKCDGTSALTSNLLVPVLCSLSAIKLTSIFFRTWRPLRESSLRIFSPAKRALSKVEGTLSSQSPSPPTTFSFAAPTLISPNLAPPSTALRACFASLREANSSPFFSHQVRKDRNGYLLTRTMQRKPRWQVEVSMGWGIRAAGR